MREALAADERYVVRVHDEATCRLRLRTGKTPLLTPGELHDLGFDLVVSPLTGLLAATRALARAYEVLRREGTLRDHLELVTTFDDFGSVIDLERHYGLEARYTDPGS